MVKVLISTDNRYPVNRNAIRQAVNGVFSKEKISDLDAEISVVVCGKRKMKQMADKYLGDGKSHEVLSFPLEDAQGQGGFVSPPDNVLRLGDVVVCFPEVIVQAAQKNVLVDEQLAFLVAHGVEHLLGKHHDEN